MRRDAASAWTQAAILSSLAEGAGELFAELTADKVFRETKAGQEFLKQLVVLVGAKNQPQEVNNVLNFLDHVNDYALMFSMTRSLGEGVQRAHQPLAGVGGVITNILILAYRFADDPATVEAARVPAIQLLAHYTYPEVRPLLLGVFDRNQAQSAQLAALTTLGKFNDDRVGGDLARRLSSFTPRMRAEALTILLARPERAEALLNAIGAGTIRANALDSTQIKLLETYRDPAIRKLAARVLTAKPAGSRQQVIDNFAPALNLNGNFARGKSIYEARCLSCHRSGGQGFALGPDFVTVKTTGKEKLLTNLIDPNREVRPEFTAYVVETKDDESLVGLVVNETATSVTLRQAYGKETVIPRANISKMQSQGVSLMPEGLEAGLAAQDMADLLEYISVATQ